MAIDKYITQTGTGTLIETQALTASSGSTNAGGIPALNTNGVLDATIVNSTTTSAGVASAGKIPALSAAGVLDNSFLPAGIGADTASVMASEDLSAGALVNIWNNAGEFNVRNADNSATGKFAMGFVLVAVSALNPATIYFEGSNTSLAGLIPGQLFMGAAGATTSTPPTGAGKVVQPIGFAVSATTMNVQIERPVILA